MAKEHAKCDLISEQRNDASIIAGLNARDESALQTLIEAHGRFVYGNALQILKDSVLAEEVTQDTLLSIWENPQRFDVSRGRLRSFLTTIARFKAIDRVRQEEVVRCKQTLFLEASSILDAAPSTGSVGDALEVYDALSQLPLAKREAIYFAYYKGLTYREVARSLGRSEGTVKTQIRDSLIKLKAILSSGSSEIV